MTILTGFKPTGELHLGNYLAAIKPTLRLAESADLAIFLIADLHALNLQQKANHLKSYTQRIEDILRQVTSSIPHAVVLRQSTVPEIAELNQILTSFSPKGLLNRAHAYKAQVEKNQAKGHPDDADVSMGLFCYPILMAADILAFEANQVPVGGDQIQHIEITRDIAQRFHRQYGEVFTLPESFVVQSEVVPGIDGRKMSKSYNNVIPFFAEPDQIIKAVKQIITDSTPPDSPKDPRQCLPYQILKCLTGADSILEERLQAGRMGYGELKTILADAIIQEQEKVTSRTSQGDLSKRNLEATVRQSVASHVRLVKEKVGLI